MKAQVYRLCAVLALGLNIASVSHADERETLLKNLYDSSVQPAAPEDFLKMVNYECTENCQRTCIAISNGRLFPFDIMRFVRVTPSFGPLIPEKSEEKILFLNTNFFNQVQAPVVSGNNLQVVVPQMFQFFNATARAIDSAVGTLKARKNGIQGVSTVLPF